VVQGNPDRRPARCSHECLPGTADGATILPLPLAEV